jgi:hypothetical protein
MSNKKKIERPEHQDRVCECSSKNADCKCEVDTDCYDHGLGTCPEVHLCTACGYGHHLDKDASEDIRYEADELDEMFA